MTVKEIAEQLKNLSDEYNARKLEEEKFREILLEFAENDGSKIFDGPSDFNKTLVWVLGKKRVAILKHLLDDTKFEMRGDQR